MGDEQSVDRDFCPGDLVEDCLLSYSHSQHLIIYEQPSIQR